MYIYMILNKLRHTYISYIRHNEGVLYHKQAPRTGTSDYFPQCPRYYEENVIFPVVPGYIILTQHFRKIVVDINGNKHIS